MKTRLGCLFAVSMAVLCALKGAGYGAEQSLSFHDLSGRFTTVTQNANFDLENPFFQSLGTNGRSCGTCHVASDAWTVTPEHIQARFWATNAQDPLFNSVDGSNCAESDTSTFSAARKAYSILLDKGLIRVKLAIPSNAEFQLVATDDPNNCESTPGSISVYRRVLPATNLKFLSTVMWDGRENSAGRSVPDDLRQQIVDAVLQHAQAAAPPTKAQIEAMLTFETGTYSAQSFSKEAGRLNSASAQGGPEGLSTQPFFIGINDPLGNNPTGAPFNPVAFTLFPNFGNGPDEEAGARSEETRHDRQQAQDKIRRGEDIFNTRKFTIANVPGLPFTSAVGTCTTCHDTPGVGDHSVSAPLNVGLTDASHRTPDLPLFTLYCPSTRETIQTTDPGRALITGKCADIGKFKGPILRALSPRAPYFHNGFAATLDDVVDFYQTRFTIGLTKEDKQDLVAFLKAL
jgi:cytochrome c peroxidase